MKRNQAVLVFAGVLILALGWVLDPWIGGPWDTILFAVPLSLVGTFLILQFMEEYEDGIRASRAHTIKTDNLNRL